jgi:ribonuclease HI
MKENELHIFSDASFSKQHQVAVAGVLFLDTASHEEEAGSPPVQTRIFKEKNNIRAELRGIIFAIERLIEDGDQTDGSEGAKEHLVRLYTDCQPIVRLLERRQRLESSNYIVRRTGKPLGNADLYRQFFMVYDKVQLNLCWIRGHSPKGGQDTVAKNFSRVDKETRKVLRDHCFGK